MERIASFCVDHRNLPKGIYLSRQDPGEIATYDIRMKVPNRGDFLSPAGAHTIEHLFAAFARNSAVKEQVIYVGPMGCLTGFYLVVRQLSPGDAIRLAQDAMAFIRDFEGEIPGSRKEECGNYLFHNLADAKAVATDMCAVLAEATPESLVYPAHLS